MDEKLNELTELDALEKVRAIITEFNTPVHIEKETIYSNFFAIVGE